MPRSAKRKGLFIRLSEAEHAAFEQVAAELDIPVSEVMRRAGRILAEAGPTLSGDDREAVMELSAQLRGLGTNLNQLAHAMNAGRWHAGRDEERLAALLVALAGQAKSYSKLYLGLCATYRRRAERVTAEAPAS